MQMMFFGFDGVRNHRRKRKARKVNIHFASTDNDRNGSLCDMCDFVNLPHRSWLSGFATVYLEKAFNGALVYVITIFLQY